MRQLFGNDLMLFKLNILMRMLESLKPFGDQQSADMTEAANEAIDTTMEQLWSSRLLDQKAFEYGANRMLWTLLEKGALLPQWINCLEISVLLNKESLFRLYGIIARFPQQGSGEGSNKKKRIVDF